MMELRSLSDRWVSITHYYMSMIKLLTQNFIEEGLQNEGATLRQIPTYVTAVPNGTEKV